jgi:hypothetical protein
MKGTYMKMLRRLTILLLFVSVCALVVGSPAQAGVSCHQINARGVGQDLGGGVTQARIIGGGLLHGTTAASFEITGLSGTVASFEGTVTFTTNRATLTVTVEGTFDVVTGAFHASGPVTDATGKLAGASGNLTFDGLENLADGSFEETVTGQICVDLSP